jgi:hypothetical protein
LDFNSAINVFSVLSYSKVAGAKSSLMWRLIGLSAVMLVTGYFGEAVFTDQAALWGAISNATYFVIVYYIW